MIGHDSSDLYRGSLHDLLCFLVTVTVRKLPEVKNALAIEIDVFQSVLVPIKGSVQVAF